MRRCSLFFRRRKEALITDDGAVFAAFISFSPVISTLSFFAVYFFASRVFFFFFADFTLRFAAFLSDALFVRARVMRAR